MNQDKVILWSLRIFTIGVFFISIVLQKSIVIVLPLGLIALVLFFALPDFPEDI